MNGLCENCELSQLPLHFDRLHWIFFTEIVVGCSLFGEEDEWSLGFWARIRGG